MHLQSKLKLTRYAVAFSPILVTYLLSLANPILQVLPGLYLASSMVTFILYAQDKRAARVGEERVPENVLHTMEFLFGWPGALIAQEALRHKSAKSDYRAMFMLLAFANVGLVSALFSYF